MPTSYSSTLSSSSRRPQLRRPQIQENTKTLNKFISPLHTNHQTRPPPPPPYPPAEAHSGTNPKNEKSKFKIYFILLRASSDALRNLHSGLNGDGGAKGLAVSLSVTGSHACTSVALVRATLQTSQTSKTSSQHMSASLGRRCIFVNTSNIICLLK